MNKIKPPKYTGSIGDDMLSNAAFKAMGKRGLELYAKYRNEPEMKPILQKADQIVQNRQRPTFTENLRESGMQNLEQLPSSIYGAAKMSPIGPLLGAAEQLPVVGEHLKKLSDGGIAGNMAKATVRYLLPGEPEQIGFPDYFKQQRTTGYEKAKKDIDRGVQMIVRRSPKTGKMEVFGLKGKNKIAHLSSKYANEDMDPGVYLWGQGDTLTPLKSALTTKGGGDILGQAEGAAGFGGSMATGSGLIGLASKGGKLGKAAQIGVALGTPLATGLVQGAAATGREAPKLIKGETEPIDLTMLGMPDREIPGPAASLLRIGGATAAPIAFGKAMDAVAARAERGLIKSLAKQSSDESLTPEQRYQAVVKLKELAVKNAPQKPVGGLAGASREARHEAYLKELSDLDAKRLELANQTYADDLRRGIDAEPVGATDAFASTPRIMEQTDFLKGSLDRLRERYGQRKAAEQAMKADQQAMGRRVLSTLDEVRRMESEPLLSGERALAAMGKERPLPYEAREAQEFIEELGQKKAQSMGMGRQVESTVDEVRRAEGKMLTPEGEEVKGLMERLKTPGKNELVQSSPGVGGMAGAVYANNQAAEADARGDEEEAAKWRAIATASLALGVGVAGGVAAAPAIGKFMRSQTVTDLAGKVDASGFLNPAQKTRNVMSEEIGKVASGAYKQKAMPMVDDAGDQLRKGIQNKNIYRPDEIEEGLSAFEATGEGGKRTISTPERQSNALDFMATRFGLDETNINNPEKVKDVAARVITQGPVDKDRTNMAEVTKLLFRTLRNIEGDDEAAKLATDIGELDLRLASQSGRDLEARKHAFETLDGVVQTTSILAKKSGMEVTGELLDRIEAAGRKLIEEGDRTGLEQIEAEIKRSVKPGLWERINGARYFSMLAGMHTVGRNLISNLAANVGRNVEDTAAYAADVVASKLTGRKPLIAAPDFKAQFQGFKSLTDVPEGGKLRDSALVRRGLEGVEGPLLRDTKKSSDISEQVTNRPFFSQNVEGVLKKPAKVVEKGERLLSLGMIGGDEVFAATGAARAISKGVREIAMEKGLGDVMAGYVSKTNPKAKGMSGFIDDIMRGGKFDTRPIEELGEKLKLTPEEIEGIKMGALAEAKVSTFRDLNILSENILKATQAMSRFGKGAEGYKRRTVGYDDIEDWYAKAPKDFQYFRQIVPFISIASNLAYQTAKKAISPATAIVNGLKLVKIAQMTPKEQGKAIKEAMGSTGKAAVALGLGLTGWKLAENGWLTTESPKSSKSMLDTKTAAGMPRFRLNIPGGPSVDVSYMQPLWPILAAGAGAYRAYAGAEEKAKQEGVEVGMTSKGFNAALGTTKGLEAVFNLPFLQGVQGFTDPSRGDTFAERATSQIGSYAGSYIPQFIAAAAKSFDPYSKDYGKGVGEQVKFGIMQRIPGLRQMVPDKVSPVGTLEQSMEGFTKKKLINKDGKVVVEKRFAPSFQALANVVLPFMFSGEKSEIAADLVKLHDTLREKGYTDKDMTNALPTAYRDIVSNGPVEYDGEEYDLTPEQKREIAREYSYNVGVALDMLADTDDYKRIMRSKDTTPDEMAKAAEFLDKKVYSPIMKAVKENYLVAHGVQPRSYKRSLLKKEGVQ